MSSQVQDDGTPNTALDIAGQAVCDFNHRALGSMSIEREGWRYAPDADRALGELTALAVELEQCFQQIITALRHELECNPIAIDARTKYEGHPELAVERVALLNRTVANASSTQMVREAITAGTGGWPSSTPCGRLLQDLGRVRAGTAGSTSNVTVTQH